MNRHARKALSDRLTRLETRLPDPPKRRPEMYCLIVQMIAYHLGAMEPRDTIVEAYARALGYASSSEYWRAADEDAAGRVTDLGERFSAATVKLLEERGINESSTPDELKSVLIALDDEVPPWARDRLIPEWGVRDFPEMFMWRGDTSSDRLDRTSTA